MSAHVLSLLSTLIRSHHKQCNYFSCLIFLKVMCDVNPSEELLLDYVNHNVLFSARMRVQVSKYDSINLLVKYEVAQLRWRRMIRDRSVRIRERTFVN